MKSMSALLMTAVLISPLFTWGASAEAFRDASCRTQLDDPFDEGWKFPNDAKSPHQGKCVDVSMKRPARLHSLDTKSIRFANFFMKGSFYEIEIPRLAVERILFQTEAFGAVGPIQPAHTQLRYILKKDMPAILRHQTGPQKGEEVARLNDVVMSADYMAPKDIPYDVFEGVTFFGMRGHFLNVLRFVSIEDRYQSMVVNSGNTVRQYELKLTPAQMDRALLAAVYLSEQKDILETYDLLRLNCTTEAFNVLAVATARKEVRWTPSVLRLTDPVAGRSIQLLQKFGLLKGEIQTLNEEFAGR